MSLVYNLDFISDKAKKSSIKKAISILDRSYYQSKEETSFFLDPFEQEVVGSIAYKNNIELVFIGGNDLAERKIFVANPYYTPLDSDNYIKVLRFSHSGLSHSDILGALMSLNLDREVIGDIVVTDTNCELAALIDEASFIKYNLSKIKNERVDVEFKDSAHLEIIESEFIEHTGFVSSLRLDNIISEFTNTSRAKAKDIIKGRNVKVNFEMIDDPSKIIEDNSTISIRKVGRFIYDGVTGSSKKGNHHISYRKLI